MAAGYRPSRVAVLEDEEREAQETSSSYAEPPIFQAISLHNSSQAQVTV